MAAYPNKYIYIYIYLSSLSLSASLSLSISLSLSLYLSLSGGCCTSPNAKAHLLWRSPVPSVDPSLHPTWSSLSNNWNRRWVWFCHLHSHHMICSIQGAHKHKIGWRQGSVASKAFSFRKQQGILKKGALILCVSPWSAPNMCNQYLSFIWHDLHETRCMQWWKSCHWHLIRHQVPWRLVNRKPPALTTIHIKNGPWTHNWSLSMLFLFCDFLFFPKEILTALFEWAPTIRTLGTISSQRKGLTQGI